MDRVTHAEPMMTTLFAFAFTFVALATVWAGAA